MNDQERDPVAWAQMQDAGRVGGVAAANDAGLEEYLASIPGKRAAELRRMFRESEAADREEA